jgi:hypothetical protein
MLKQYACTALFHCSTTWNVPDQSAAALYTSGSAARQIACIGMFCVSKCCCCAAAAAALLLLTQQAHVLLCRTPGLQFLQAATKEATNIAVENSHAMIQLDNMVWPWCSYKPAS